jgi:hypothetical protein
MADDGGGDAPFRRGDNIRYESGGIACLFDTNYFYNNHLNLLFAASPGFHGWPGVCLVGYSFATRVAIS